MAPHPERRLDPGTGDGGESAAGVVAVRAGPRVEGEGPQPRGKAAPRLSGVRRADEGDGPGAPGPGGLVHPNGC